MARTNGKALRPIGDPPVPVPSVCPGGARPPPPLHPKACFAPCFAPFTLFVPLVFTQAGWLAGWQHTSYLYAVHANAPTYFVWVGHSESDVDIGAS